MVRRLASLIAIAGLLGSAACDFAFDRDDELEPGDVTGRVLLRGAPVAGAVVEVVGDPRRRVTGDDGTFRVPGLLPSSWPLAIKLDADGDGVPEAAAYRAVTVHRLAPPSGLFAPPEEPVPIWIALGDLELDDVGELRGRALDGRSGGPLPGARVAVYRTLDLPAATLSEGAAREAARVTLPVEHVTAADAEGFWRAPGIAPGDVQVVAIANGEGGETLSGAPLDATAVAGVSVTVPTIVLESDTGTARVDVWFDPDAPGRGRMKLVAVPAGAPRPDESLADLSDGAVFDEGRDAEVDMAAGLVDLHTRAENGEHAVLRARLIAGGATGVTLGPARFWAPEARGGCGSDEPDCDGDGVPSLPWERVDGRPTVTDIRPWAGCAQQCGSSWGTGGASECVTGGEPYDCDDDADGQPDVTEPAACLGLTGGRDSDGDGVCDPADPFPRCREDDPAAEACAVDAVPDPFDRPQVRPEYGGPPIPVVDAGPGDAGPEDAGDAG